MEMESERIRKEESNWLNCRRSKEKWLHNITWGFFVLREHLAWKRIWKRLSPGGKRQPLKITLPHYVFWLKFMKKASISPEMRRCFFSYTVKRQKVETPLLKMLSATSTRTVFTVFLKTRSLPFSGRLNRQSKVIPVPWSIWGIFMK